MDQGFHNCIIFVSLIFMTLCFASVLSNLLTAGSNPNNLAIRLFLMSMKCQSHAQHNGLSLMLHKTALLSQTDRVGHMQAKFKCTQTGVFHGHIFKIKKVRFASGESVLKLCEL